MGTGKPVPRRTCGFHCCWDNTYDHLRSPKHIWGCLQSSPTLYYCLLLEGLVTEKPFVAVHADNPLRSSWPRLCKIRTDLMPLWCNHSLKQPPGMSNWKAMESYGKLSAKKSLTTHTNGIQWHPVASGGLASFLVNPANSAAYQRPSTPKWLCRKMLVYASKQCHTYQIIVGYMSRIVKCSSAAALSGLKQPYQRNRKHSWAI